MGLRVQCLELLQTDVCGVQLYAYWPSLAVIQGQEIVQYYVFYRNIFHSSPINFVCVDVIVYVYIYNIICTSCHMVYVMY